MIVFTDPDQILDAINNVSEEFYNNAIEAIRENYELAKTYIHPEDLIYKQALNV
jgi:hypothetical protein